jgi:Tannase and feruloyl esterase
MISHTVCRVLRHATLAAAIAAVSIAAAPASAQTPVTTCDSAGIGSVHLTADGPPVTIESVSAATAGSGATAVPYCLVKVLVPQAIHIWVGLPMDAKWNGRWQSLGGGGYAGSVSAPTSAVLRGFAGATTDTGHTGGDGSFGMLAPGVPNIPLQIDFAYRSEHLMAVIGKQLVQAFYGQPPAYSYWNGCSTGGRQGLRMAQDYPDDYDGILAGAPAIHWDRFQAGQIWYQVVQLRDNGGPIGGGHAPTLIAKENLATAKAVAACDALDGVEDGVLDDPRACSYRAAADATLTTSACMASDPTCLTPTEASAIDKMWKGPVSCSPGHRGATCPVPDFAMAPGVGHCGGGSGPQPQGLFDAVVNWVENAQAPDSILATRTTPVGTRSRPLCPYPASARWIGIGSTDDAANFVCE